MAKQESKAASETGESVGRSGSGRVDRDATRRKRAESNARREEAEVKERKKEFASEQMCDVTAASR